MKMFYTIKTINMLFLEVSTKWWGIVRATILLRIAMKVFKLFKSVQQVDRSALEWMPGSNG